MPLTPVVETLFHYGAIVNVRFGTAKEPVMPEVDPPLAEKQIGLNHIL